MTAETIRIRRATRGDGESIWRVHTAAIRGSWGERYAPEEIDAWISRLSPSSYDGLIRGKAMYVAQDDNRVVGFGQLDVMAREVDAVYVLPDASGRGVGGLLLRTLEDVARECGVKRLALNASLNSVAFYQNRGYEPKGRSRCSSHADLSLECVRMEKDLSRAGAPVS